MEPTLGPARQAVVSLSEPQDARPVPNVPLGATDLPIASLLGEYGWDVTWAKHVLYCESGGNPLAYNPAGPFVGLMQVWLGHRWTYEQLIQPEINLAAAWEIYQRQGKAAWPGCGR